MIDHRLYSLEEQHLEALLLARILQDDTADGTTARAVARAEAGRLHRLSRTVIEHLHDARVMFDEAVIGSVDRELLCIIINIEDAFGETIASELRAWRGVANYIKHCL